MTDSSRTIRSGFSRYWDRIVLGILLLLGLAHAVFYVFFIPPWYHHDEPSHLEYVLLVARLGRIPQENERQQDIAYAIGRSMIETGFSNKMGGVPDLNPEPGKITQIGFSQLDGPPLYYLLAAIPVRLYQGEDILVQLYLARLVSGLFYLLNVLAAWGIAREIFTPQGTGRLSNGSIHFMQFALPAFLVVWPAHVDIMTAVNTDAPAIACSGLALWGITRFVRIAFSENRIAWNTVLGTFLAASLALAFKETSVVVLPAVLVGLLFSLPRCWSSTANHPLKKFIRNSLAWLALMAFALLGGLLVLRDDDAAYWLRLTDQVGALRRETQLAPDGSFVAAIALNVQRFPSWHVNFYQSLVHERLPSSYPVDLTLGVWMWADEPLETALPTFSVGTDGFTRQVSLTTEPQFFVYSFTLPAISAPTVRISLKPFRLSGKDVNIYIDGLVLAEGLYPQAQLPIFSDESADSGLWGGKPFNNIVRNGSFEQAGLRFASWLDRGLANYFPDQSLPSAWLQASLDWEGMAYYFEPTAAHLFRTFWARFAWGNLALVPDFPLIGAYPYRKIGYLCLVLIGLTLGMLVSRLVRPHRKSHEGDEVLPYPAVLEIFFIYALTTGLAWGITLLRGALYTGVARLFYPVARYALPAVLPSLLILLTGWGMVTETLQTRFAWARWISIIIFLVALVFLNALSLESILVYLAK